MTYPLLILPAPPVIGNAYKLTTVLGREGRKTAVYQGCIYKEDEIEYKNTKKGEMSFTYTHQLEKFVDVEMGEIYLYEMEIQ